MASRALSPIASTSPKAPQASGCQQAIARNEPRQAGRLNRELVPCEACSGFGTYEVASGPGYVSVECEECHGMGEVDHNCPPDAICPECRSMPLHMLHERAMRSLEAF